MTHERGGGLEELRNVGPASWAWLVRVGVRSRADLAAIGAAAAFLKVCDAGGRPTRNLLWALEAALQDLDWRDLPEGDKQRLEREAALLGWTTPTGRSGRWGGS